MILQPLWWQRLWQNFWWWKWWGWWQWWCNPKEPCCQHTYYRARWLLPQHDQVPCYHDDRSMDDNDDDDDAAAADDDDDDVYDFVCNVIIWSGF